MQSSLVNFIQVLRSHDVRVSPAETLDAMDVASTLGYTDRTRLRDGLAMALANQRIVLEKVQAINTTTENLIAGTAQRLKTQGAEIQKQASSTQLDIDKLRQAFSDIHGALDDLTAMMVDGGTLQTVAPDVRAIFRRELAERRAEAFARYHLVQARRFENAADWVRARSHLTRLMNELRNAARSTEFVRGLYTEAQAASVALGSGRSRVAAETAEPPAMLAETG